MSGGREDKRREGGPDPDSWNLQNLPPPEVGCKNCSARGVALLDPCMGVVDGGLHQTYIVPASLEKNITWDGLAKRYRKDRSPPDGRLR